MLRKKIILVVLLSLITGTLMAQEAKVTSLMSKDLKDFPGKEGLMITVEYPPGGYRPYTSSQCTRNCIRAGGLHRHAAERRKRSHADTRTDLL